MSIMICSIPGPTTTFLVAANDVRYFCNTTIEDSHTVEPASETF